MGEPQKEIAIAIMENGPLIVKGLEAIVDSNGEQIQTKERFALCRCGASNSKPFCDGTHKDIDFAGQRDLDKPLNRERAYPGDKITVYDNRVICSHSGNCVRNLNSVFDPNKRPWIDPNGADVEKIIATVSECPSGALSYAISDVHYRNLEREPAIRVSANGPYDVTGSVKLEIDETLQPPSNEHYSLCRCGASKNKPYCDGTHVEIDFKG